MSVPGTNPNITGAYYVQYASPYSKAVAFSYINDPSLVLYTQQGVAYATGGFRPMATTDLMDITLTGVSISIGAVAVTGSPLVTIAGVSSVSVSGGYIGITGAPLVTPVFTGAPAVTPVFTGSHAVTSYTPTATPSNFTVSGSVGTMVTGNALPATARTQFYVQNVGSGSALYVKLGVAPASAQSFSFILKAATADFGADGGVYTNTFYTGTVSISGATHFIAWDA